MGDLNVSVGYLEELSSELDVMDWAQDQRSRGCTIVAVQANGACGETTTGAVKDHKKSLHHQSRMMLFEVQLLVWVF